MKCKTYLQPKRVAGIALALAALGSLPCTSQIALGQDSSYYRVDLAETLTKAGSEEWARRRDSAQKVQPDFAVETLEDFVKINQYYDKYVSDGIKTHDFRTALGDEIHCIVVATQQSVISTGIDPANIPLQPTVPPNQPTEGTGGIAQQLSQGLGASQGLDGTFDDTGRERACPKGTFPKLIFPRENLYRFKKFEDIFRKRQGITSSDPTVFPVSSKGHEYAHAYQYVTNWGSSAVFNLWSPFVQPTSAFSLAQLWVAGGSGDGEQTIEAGWQVYPQKYGDNNARLFIFSTSDHYASGCYNLDCGRFVQTNNSIILGGLFDNYSSKGGPQYDVTLTTFRDRGGAHNWWLMVGTTTVGYYPNSLYNSAGLADQSILVDFGGELVDSSSGELNTQTYMGSGGYPSEGFQQAAYIKKIKYVDLNYTYQNALQLTEQTTLPNQWDIGPVSTSSDSNWLTYFYFGGPGSILPSTSIGQAVNVRTYVPASTAAGGYVSFLRVINATGATSPVTVARVDPNSGLVTAAGTLTPALAGYGAVTFSANQVETALGTTLAPADRPRIRVSAAATNVKAQSFMLQPGGVFNEVSPAQSGASITLSTYIPAAGAPTGYQSYVRVINVGTSATTVTVAYVNPTTGQAGNPVPLIAPLAAGAALTYNAAQIEAALGLTLAGSERPTLIIAGNGTTLEAQSFLTQPGGAFTNVSSSQSGATVDVRNYVPAAAAGYATYLRVINNSSSSTPIIATVLDGNTGAAGATGTIIQNLLGNASLTLPSSQIEAALGVNLPATSRPRLRVSAAGGSLTVQSFMLQPGGAFNEFSGAQTGTSIFIRTYIPAADAVTGYTSYLRIINTGTIATPVTAALVDGDSGALGTVAQLIASLPAGAAQSFTPSQVEAALGTPIAAGTRPRILISGNGVNVLEVQSFLIQPGGVFTEVSGGQ